MVSVTNLLKGQSVDSNSSHVRIDINQIFIQRYTELFVFLLLSLVFEIVVTAVNDVKKFLRFSIFQTLVVSTGNDIISDLPPFAAA